MDKLRRHRKYNPSNKLREPLDSGDLKDMLILNRKDVQELLDLDDLLVALAEGFITLSKGNAVVPDRNQVIIPDTGYLMAMPAWQPGSMLGVKLITVFHENTKLSLPGHQALMCVFDPTSGTLAAIMDGTYITAMRTAASSALSVSHLARKDTRVLAIIGAGVQGQSHLRVLSRVRNFEEIRIASLFFEDAQKLAGEHPRARAVKSFEDAVRSADVVCLCTASNTAVVEAAWISPGTHITSVGYNPPGSELPVEIIPRARLIVETRRSFEPPPAGCCELAGLNPSTGTELGEILSGIKPGRKTEQEITLYKSMGHAIEDLAAANLVYLRARQQGSGSAAEL
jgi:ornithine cyclodeaminase/alanine dehydrogenase-like protein (mu-crystallin family)